VSTGRCRRGAVPPRRPSRFGCPPRLVFRRVVFDGARFASLLLHLLCCPSALCPRGRSAPCARCSGTVPAAPRAALQQLLLPHPAGTVPGAARSQSARRLPFRMVAARSTSSPRAISTSRSAWASASSCSRRGCFSARPIFIERALIASDLCLPLSYTTSGAFAPASSLLFATLG
jgi:hypothetical protein